MRQIKKKLIKGFAALTAASTLGAVAVPAFAESPAFHYDPDHPCAMVGFYDINNPASWRQDNNSSGSAEQTAGFVDPPSFLSQPFPRKFAHPLQRLIETDELGLNPHQLNFSDGGCGAHTWANVCLKSGYASQGYSAFDAGHYFSEPAHSDMDQDTGAGEIDSDKPGTDTDNNPCYSPRPAWYRGDYAKYITKIKNYGAPYAWNDIDNPDQYPAGLNYAGWLRDDDVKNLKDKDLADNQKYYFTESTEVDCQDFTHPITPTAEEIRTSNRAMERQIRQAYKDGYIIALAMMWRQYDPAHPDKPKGGGGHIVAVDYVDDQDRIVLLDSGGGFKYWDDLKEYWKSDGVTPHIAFFYKVKPAGLSGLHAPKFWEKQGIPTAHNYIDSHKKRPQLTDDDYNYVLDESAPLDSPDNKVKEPVAGWSFEDGTEGTKSTKGEIKYSYKSIAPSTTYKLDKTEQWYNKEDKTSDGTPGKLDPHAKGGSKTITPAEPIVYTYGYKTVEPTVKYECDKTMAKDAPDVTVDPGVIGLIDPHANDPNGSVVRAMKQKVVKYAPEYTDYDTQYVLDKTLEPGQTKTEHHGKPGLADPRNMGEGHIIQKMETEIVHYGAGRIKPKTIWHMNKDMAPGDTKQITPGKLGYTDPRAGDEVVEPAVDEVMEYGPKHKPFEIEKIVDPTMAPNADAVVVQQGVDGLYDHDGNLVQEPVNEIMHIAPTDKPTPIDPAPVDPTPVDPVNPITPVTPVTPVTPTVSSDIPFGIEFQADPSLPQGETRVIRDGVAGHAEDGKTVTEPVNAVVAYGPIQGSATVTVHATNELNPGDRKIINAGKNPAYDPDGNLVGLSTPYEFNFGTDGKFFTVPDKVTFTLSPSNTDSVDNTTFSYSKTSYRDFLNAFNTLDGQPTTMTPFTDAMNGKFVPNSDVKGTILRTSLSNGDLKQATDVTFDKDYINLPEGTDEVYAIEKLADGKTYRVPIADNNNDSIRVQVMSFGTFMFMNKKPKDFDSLPLLPLTQQPRHNYGPLITPQPPQLVETPGITYVTNDQYERGIASRTYIYDPTTHTTTTNDQDHKKAVVRQPDQVVFAHEKSKNPGDHLVTDGKGHFYKAYEKPAGHFVNAAKFIRKIQKAAKTAPRTHIAPVQHAALPPAAPIIHRQAPNVAPGTESGTKPNQRRNFETPENDKKDDSKKNDSTDKSTDKSKDSTDKKDDNTTATTTDNTTSDNKDPDRDKAGDYSVSMKNKDPKIKDADKQVKLKKKQSSSSLPWIIVISFVVLGAIAIGGFYWYRKSQENYA